MYAQLGQRSRKLRELDQRFWEQVKPIEKVKKKSSKSKNKLMMNQRFGNSNKVLMKINPQIITR